jgi:hypothetical protein
VTIEVIAEQPDVLGATVMTRALDPLPAEPPPLSLTGRL